MTNNLIIPETLLPIASILSDYLQPLLAWASQFIFQQLLTQNNKHPLIVIERILDFPSLEQACVMFHEPTAVRGHPVETIHNVESLTRNKYPNTSWVGYRLSHTTGNSS